MYGLLAIVVLGGMALIAFVVGATLAKRRNQDSLTLKEAGVNQRIVDEIRDRAIEMSSVGDQTAVLFLDIIRGGDREIGALRAKDRIRRDDYP